jgi:hypothetical protein
MMFVSKLEEVDRTAFLINSLVGNSVPTIAIAKSCGWSVVDLADWSVEQYCAKGYHDVWISKHGKANANVYADFFVQSRKHVSEHESIVQGSNTQIRIISTPLYLSNPPEALFFFEVDLEELCAYFAALAVRHAELLGVKVDIFYDKNSEVATIAPLLE